MADPRIPSCGRMRATGAIEYCHSVEIVSWTANARVTLFSD